ncbi:MAG: PilZ domain-containing protein [Terriglobia bacterium]
MRERRARQRFPLRLRVHWRHGNGQSEEVHSGETLNLSSTGVYLLPGESTLAAGQRIEVSVRLPVAAAGAGTCLSGSGQVVRVDSQSREQVRVAVALDRMRWLRWDESSTAT